jgi:integrase/recombinase XerD
MQGHSSCHKATPLPFNSLLHKEVTMKITTPSNQQFNSYYEKHLKLLKLRGMRPKTIDAYSRTIRRVGNYFNGRVDDLTPDQLLDYFSELVESHSWSTVKLDLYGLKFFYTMVLNKTWDDIPLIKPQKLPGYLTFYLLNR